MIDSNYFNQAKVLLERLPLLQKEEVFALKGGTAINFFIRDLPRLSVDIDLTYLPVNERDIAFKDISRSLINLKNRIERLSPDTQSILNIIFFHIYEPKVPNYGYLQFKLLHINVKPDLKKTLQKGLITGVGVFLEIENKNQMPLANLLYMLFIC